MKLILVGMDPSLRNWGLAKGIYDTDTKELQVTFLDVVNPAVPEGKQVRQNSKDLVAAQQLFSAAHLVCNGAHAVFVEVPIGSQSA